MSVIKAFRQESKIQFIDTARELVVHTLTYCKKFPKSAMFLMTKDIAELAKNIYIQVVSANVIFPNSETDIEERKKHFDQALGYIDSLDCFLGIAKDSYTSNEEGKKISDYGWIHWGELLENEKNLIKKVLSADSKRISA